MNDVMPGSDGLGFLVILEKKTERVGIRVRARPVQLFAAGGARARLLGQMKQSA